MTAGRTALIAASLCLAVSAFGTQPPLKAPPAAGKTAHKQGGHKPPPKADPVEQAIRNGEALPGMSPGQVRRAMAGAPQYVLRTASSLAINEVWIFERVGRTRTVVHFRRHHKQPRSESRVVNVSRFRQ